MRHHYDNTKLVHVDLLGPARKAQADVNRHQSKCFVPQSTSTKMVVETDAAVVTSATDLKIIREVGTGRRGEINRGGSNGVGRANATAWRAVRGRAGNEIQPIQEKDLRPHQVYVWDRCYNCEIVGHLMIN